MLFNVLFFLFNLGKSRDRFELWQRLGDKTNWGTLKLKFWQLIRSLYFVYKFFNLVRNIINSLFICFNNLSYFRITIGTMEGTVADLGSDCTLGIFGTY